MAPKAAVKAKAKAKPKPETPKKRQREEDQNAIDRADDGVSPAAKRQKQEDSVEADTSKAVTDNFKGFSDFQLRMVLDKDGKSIFDRVYERKLAKLIDNSLPCGKNFYSEVKEEFFGNGGGPTFPAVPLEDIEDAELFLVLKAVIRHNRDFVPCSTYLSVASKLNTLNLQALLQAPLKISPGGKRGECTEFVLDVMRYITIVGHGLSHPESVAACKHHFDSALCKDLIQHRSNEGTAIKWWETRQSFAKLVLPIGPTEKCLQKGVKALVVMTELREVADSSIGGRMLAQKPLQDAQLDTFMNVVKDILSELPPGNLTVALLDANHAKFFKRCAEIGAKPTETHKAKYYEFVHLGVGFTMPVHSLLETYNIARECLVKTDGVVSGKLEPLFCELQLGKKPLAEAGAMHVDASLLVKTKHCRDEAAKFMQGEEPTAQKIADMYKNRISHLLTFDKFAKLEQKFFAA